MHHLEKIDSQDFEDDLKNAAKNAKKGARYEEIQAIRGGGYKKPVKQHGMQGLLAGAAAHSHGCATRTLQPIKDFDLNKLMEAEKEQA